MNMVYVKVELAKMNSGAILEVILDDGQPVKNVTRSIESEDHELLEKNQRGEGSWAVRVKKVCDFFTFFTLGSTILKIQEARVISQDIAHSGKNGKKIFPPGSFSLHGH